MCSIFHNQQDYQISGQLFFSILIFRLFLVVIPIQIIILEELSDIIFINPDYFTSTVSD